MIPIRYQVVGEEEYAFRVEIDAEGQYLIHGGTYATQPPRKGRLTPAQESEILAAIRALGVPAAHDVPEEGSGFRAELSVGGKGESATYPFWEGALEHDAGLRHLVRLLERL